MGLLDVKRAQHGVVEVLGGLAVGDADRDVVEHGLYLCRDQVGVLRMPLNVSGGEAAVHRHGQTALTNVVQRPCDQPTPHAVPLEPLGNLRVEQDEPARALPIHERTGQLAVHVRLVLAGSRIVGNENLRPLPLAHARNRTSLGVPSQKGLFLDWPQRQNAALGSSSVLPSASTTRIGPRTSNGTFGIGVTSSSRRTGRAATPTRRRRSAADGQLSTAVSISSALAGSRSIQGRRPESNTAGNALTQFCE